MIQQETNNIEKEQYGEILYWNQLKEGERRGLEGLYLKYSRELFRYGMAVHADSSLIKDCIQELFIDLWKYRGNLKSTNKIQIYLCKSLAHKIFRELQLEKRRRDQNPLEVYEVLYNQENPKIFHQFGEDNLYKLHNAVANLPERQREIIQHVFFDKLSSEEISRKMGIAIQSVYTLTWKAVSKLKKSFLFIFFLI